MGNRKGVHVLLYDPTVFDNLKVALENQLYDLDTLDEHIHICNRRDVMDFAVMSRTLAIQFVLRENETTTVELMLTTELADLAGEILEHPDSEPGCSLQLQFTKRLTNPATECPEIEQTLNTIWEQDIQVTQTLSSIFGAAKSDVLNTIDVAFRPRLNEENMNELSPFLAHVLETLQMLNTV